MASGSDRVLSGAFSGVRFHRLLSVPSFDAGDDPAAGLFAALTAAHAELSAAQEDPAAVHAGPPATGRAERRGGPALVMAWQRTAPGVPIQLLVGGRPHFPPAGREPAGPETIRPVLYPPGSTGREVDAAAVVAGWRSMPAWVPCAGHADPLWAVPAAGRARRGGFADCVAHTADPFVWLVHAVPEPPQTTAAELADLAARIPALRQRENSQLDRIALERAQERYRELSRTTATGTWRVRIAVGGLDPVGCRRVAALLCAAGELEALPYLLVPGREVTSFSALPFSATPGTAGTGSATGPGSTVGALHATSELLAALTAPPRRELPGLRVVEPPSFDVTPENDGDVHLGDVLDAADRPAGPFAVRLDTLNRHAFVAGATGSGKSQTVRHLLEGLHRAGVPWLVIEPAKAEYARMAGRIGADRVAVIRPGAPDAVPLSLNPLEPEPGFPLSAHIDLLRALFLAAFEAAEPFPQVLARALSRCYGDLGWDVTLGSSVHPHAVPRYPDLGDLRRTALDVVAGIGYGREVADNVRGFVDVRLQSLLLGAPGRFFGGGHPLDMADLLRRNVVMEVEDVGNDQDTAFLIGAVLVRLHEHLRVHRAGRPAGLRHVTVVEEAHRLLKRAEPGSPAAHAVELFSAMLAEIRAYGEGIVVAEQIPAKIVADVVKNTALKIVHRLPAADDRAVVGATMNLDDAQSRHVVALPPGRAAVFAEGMDRPVRVGVPLGEARESGPPPVGEVAAARCAGPACPPSCRARPCTLREMVQASRIAQNAELALWIELLTAAHVLGYPEPVPADSWFDRLRGSADRVRLDCALGHLAADAVHRRYVALVAHYQPEDLARHVAERARARLDALPGGCDGSEVEWQAGLFRWRDVFVAFTQEDYDPALPHPLTAAWRARGLSLGDVPAREQLLALQRLPGSRITDRTAVDGAGDTSGAPPAYRRLAAELSRPGPPMDRFVEATRFLTFSSAWPLHRLYPDEWDRWQADRGEADSPRGNTVSGEHGEQPDHPRPEGDAPS